MTAQPRRLRLFSLLLWLALLLGVLLLTNVHYDLNDDMVLLRSFAGCVGGVAETYNVYTHALLTWTLHGLSVVFPAVAWFSVFQLFLLALSAYMGIHAILLLCGRTLHSIAAGGLVAILFEGGLMFAWYAGITGTLTAAVAGSAAVLALLAPPLRREPRAMLREASASLGLLVLAYLLRPIAVLPALCFWVGALLCRCLTAAPETDGQPSPARPTRLAALRSTLTLLGVGMLLWGALFAVQAVDDALSNEKAYVDWQDATTAAVDYFKVGQADAATLREIGWTENERQLVMDWYFMDGDMSTQAFSRLGSLPNTGGVAEALGLIGTLFRRSRGVFKTTALLASLCGCAFILAFFSKQRRVWRALSPAGCFGVAACLLLYLAWQGRLPMRVAMSILLPACALGLGLFIENVAAALFTPITPGGGSSTAVDRRPAMGRFHPTVDERAPMELNPTLFQGNPNPPDCCLAECDLATLASNPAPTEHRPVTAEHIPKLAENSSATPAASATDLEPRLVKAAVSAAPAGQLTSKAAALPGQSAWVIRLLVAVFTLGCMAVGLSCAKTAVQSVYQPLATFRQAAPTRYTLLERYALSHPELLLIAENRFGLERRLFPDWRDGKATNVLYAWGGWNNRSQGYRALLAQFGFSQDYFSVTDFLADSVRLVSDQPAPSEVLLRYLEEKLGRTVGWDIEYAGDGFYVLALRLG